MRLETIFVMATIFSSSDTASLNSVINCCSTTTAKPQLSSFITTLHGPNIKHNFQQYLCCCLRIRWGGNVFTDPLPGNVCLLWLHYSDLQAPCHSINKTDRIIKTLPTNMQFIKCTVDRGWKKNVKKWMQVYTETAPKSNIKKLIIETENVIMSLPGMQPFS
jgi:hypothetical protein